MYGPNHNTECFPKEPSFATGPDSAECWATTVQKTSRVWHRAAGTWTLSPFLSLYRTSSCKVIIYLIINLLIWLKLWMSCTWTSCDTKRIPSRDDNYKVSQINPEHHRNRTFFSDTNVKFVVNLKGAMKLRLCSLLSSSCAPPHLLTSRTSTHRLRRKQVHTEHTHFVGV